MALKIDIKTVKDPYNYKVGLIKTLKNTVVFMGPSLIAFLLGVQGEYAWIAGVGAYFVKNLIENWKN